MHIAYLVITLVFALMVTFSGVGKIRRDPIPVRVVHEAIGLPLKYFPLLAVCEFAGAIGLVTGIWWPGLGVAAGIGLVLYFVAAIVSHLRVGDRNVLLALGRVHLYEGRSPARVCAELPRRIPSSAANGVPSMSMGTICPANAPESVAAAAFSCEATENSSSCSRDSPQRSAIISALRPWLKEKSS